VTGFAYLGKGKDRAMSHDAIIRGELDWATAEVRSGRLKVGLTGDVSKAWALHLDEVVSRLDHVRQWEKVKITRRAVKVTGVAAGHEGELQHVLEAAILQANADFACTQGDSGNGDDDRDEKDRKMTEAFRAIGG
jgi:hypothetical protein